MSTAGAPQDAANRQLTSWKEIAAYLQRDVRTVQRWEKNEGLPVHRLMHDVRASVYVTTDELDEWVARRAVTREPKEPFTGVSEPVRKRHWLWAAAGITAMALASAALWKSPADNSVRIQQLLMRPDIDGAGALSWDGRFLPYRNNNAELMLYRIDTGQSQRVLSQPENVRRNFLNFIASPDGSQNRVPAGRGRRSG